MACMRLVLLCAFSLSGFALCAAVEKTAPKPNIIVIYTDDHGHADLGIQGVVKDIKTPQCRWRLPGAAC